MSFVIEFNLVRSPGTRPNIMAMSDILERIGCETANTVTSAPQLNTRC